MPDGREPSARLIGALAAVCIALFVWSYIGFALPFRAAAGGRDVLDIRIGGYDSADVVGMLEYLRDHPDAASILRSLHLGPELVLPALLAVLLFLLLRIARPGGSFFGRALPAIVIAALFFLPVLYAAADYAENVASLTLFPPATPSDGTVAFFVWLLPLLTRLKFAMLAIILILLARFTLLRSRSPDGEP
jgi:hypothetical protein